MKTHHGYGGRPRAQRAQKNGTVRAVRAAVFRQIACKLTPANGLRTVRAVRAVKQGGAAGAKVKAGF